VPAANKKTRKKTGRTTPIATQATKKTAGAKLSTDPIVAFCRTLPGATEDVKWGNDLVWR